MAKHVCVFSKFIKKWKVQGKTWARYQCNQCTAQEIVSL